MGKRGGRRGRGRGGGNNVWHERANKADVIRTNTLYESYYEGLGIADEDEMKLLWEAMRRDLPNSFRFAGSKGHALAVQRRLIEFYIPQITSIKYNGENVEPPHPIQWYPDQLAWYMTTPKHIVRRFAPFSAFQKFLVAETDVGSISRQEVVSMIPPLCMDIKPGMTVLDLCAAPGSKSAQLLEMLQGGEEERSRMVAQHLANGLDRPSGEGYEDDGRSTGLLIANDVDSRRAHMLVHQLKRLGSANILITNHDATVFPSIKLPSDGSVEGKSSGNKYLKFDRILADVPCSGDGTCRKNLEIWSKWNPASAIGLHQTQLRILIRALQMLKVGGRVVYSTCSMNPVENEAVLAAAIDRCGGTEKVEIQDSSEYLPGLKRKPGLTNWKIIDKKGGLWSTYQEVIDQREKDGPEILDKLRESMFAPEDDVLLDRAMRVYPHMQDTGAFFIAILEKKSELRVRAEPPKHTNPPRDDDARALKRSTEDDADDKPDKRNKLEHPEVKEEPPKAEATNGTSRGESYKMKNSGQSTEEPFKYLNSEREELEGIWKFYGISPEFPRDRFMVRNENGTASKNIYYTIALARTILQENEGKGMKFVHSGIKMFVKQDVPRPDTCPWRIQSDGLPLIEAWVSPHRRVKLWKRETLRKLLVEMFPRTAEGEWVHASEIASQVEETSMGCLVLEVEPREDEESLQERMILPLWKSLYSVNLMLAKEDRKALLLRLFNDETPLVNLSQRNAAQQEAEKNKEEEKDEKVEVERKLDNDKAMGDDDDGNRRNSSSENSPGGSGILEDQTGVRFEPGTPE